jgi:outer membrane protein assembly factor BamB
MMKQTRRALIAPILVLGMSLAAVASGVAGAAPAAPAKAARGSKPLWSRQLGKPAGITSLTAAGDVVIAGTWEMRVVGVDSRTGRTLWSKQHPTLSASDLMVAVSGGRVVAATSEDIKLSAYEPRTGKLAWQRELTQLGSLAACPGYRLIAVTHRGRTPEGATTLLAHAMDPGSGKTLWQTPVDGPILGSGDGWLITAKMSDTGRLMSSLSALRCSDGKVQAMPAPRRAYAGFLHAAAGKVVSNHFEFDYEQETVCVTDIEAGKQQCFDATDGQTPLLGVNGALFKDGVVHVATGSMYAKNLDPQPDAWVFRYDVAKRRMVGKSEALTSNGVFADGGGQIVTGFGSTGAADIGYVLDPATGERLASVALRKAPRAVAVDRERAYFGTYDGRVVAVALPRPGPAPVAEAAVAARQVATPRAGPGLGWQLVRTFDAHPRRARSSGSQTDGRIMAVAFLDEERVALGGNDDFVAVYDVAQGKEVWRSKKLGKDVEQIGACENGFAASVYGGKLTVFTPARSGRGWSPQKTIQHATGWFFGVSSSCAVVVDDFDGEFTIYEGGQKRATFSAPGALDRRGLAVVGPHLVISQPGELQVIDVAAAARSGTVAGAVQRFATPTEGHGGALSQAWLLGDGRLLREYCGPVRCVVEIVDSRGKSGRAAKTLELDTRGAGWAASVPSMIAAAPDGSALVFFRRNLDLVITDIGTGKRQALSELGGLPRDLVVARFSPSGKRIVVAGYPMPWQVTILERP